MKKILAITLSLASIGFVASTAEAKASSASMGATVEHSAAAQWERNRYNRRVRVFNRTRVVRIGRRLYRETYQVRQLPNGRTTTRLISRVRIR